MRLVSLAITAAFVLGGCTLGPNYHRPDFHSQDIGKWQSGLNTKPATQKAEAEAWWQQLNDPLLNDLIAGALHENRDLGVALANIERARALRRVAGGSYYPTLDASGSATRTRFSRQTGFGANTGTRNTFSASLDASWELDLFGRTRRAVEAADAQIQASEAARRGLILSVVAEVASNYFEARGLQRQLEVTQQDIGLLREVEEIARAQSELGVTTELDLTRAVGERETFEAKLPNLEAEIAARIYRISVLTGQAPAFHAKALQESQPLPMPPDMVPVGLPSDILRRRPDVQQAERELASATAGIGVAKADLFPTFSLTGSIGSSARVFSDLFTPATLTRSVGAGLAWPVFAGGSLTAGVDVAEADAKAALAAYEQSVLLALEDGEASLMRYGKEWQTLKRLQSAEATRQQAFEIARLRYEAGEENFLVILDAERALIATRNDIINSETRILTGLAQLYKALGGGWQSDSEQVVQ
jgi:multidrug efflux system outer membrane protein